jgi:hypothetical protein
MWGVETDGDPGCSRIRASRSSSDGSRAALPMKIPQELVERAGWWRRRGLTWDGGAAEQLRWPEAAVAGVPRSKTSGATSGWRQEA